MIFQNLNIFLICFKILKNFKSEKISKLKKQKTKKKN
jgi:hypothetical protein